MCKTVATKGDSVPANLQVLIQVPLGHCSVGRNSVVFGNTNLEAFLRPQEHIDVLVLVLVLDCSLTVGIHLNSVSLEGGPVSAVNGSSDASALTVHEFVPQGVQLINGVVVLQGDQVTALVAVGVSLIVEVQVMEGLVHIPNVVDQQAQSIRFSKIFITFVKTIQDVVVNVATFVLFTILSSREPLDQICTTVGHVVLVVVVVVDTIIVLILEYVVLKVEVRLPSATVVLDIIGESSALNEGVVFLTVGQLRIVNLQVR